ncbi:MAG: MerR family transcriptional regulator [Frankiaceae bacterium]|nr:MerR family transcriptional regulator [Frankiaceae bacterium]
MAPDEEMLSIGRFARLTGLTAKALRHYDAEGVFAPSYVDPSSGYRYYGSEQVETGRLIQRLRSLDLPLPEVARLIALQRDNPSEFDVALVAQRQRLLARVMRLQGQLHNLDHLIADKGIVAVTQTTTIEDTAAERKIAVDLFNHVWTLLEKEDRTESEEAEMIHSAHASTVHWMHVGEPVNRARGEWQCSRVYAVLGRGEPAVFHAKKVLEICQREGIGDWDLAFAYEALARATAVAGDIEEAHRWAEQARAACTDVAEDDDREIVLSDLATLPAGV